jgi:hypothetical protein
MASFIAKPLDQNFKGLLQLHRLLESLPLDMPHQDDLASSELPQMDFLRAA